MLYTILHSDRPNNFAQILWEAIIVVVKLNGWLTNLLNWIYIESETKKAVLRPKDLNFCFLFRPELMKWEYNSRFMRQHIDHGVYDTLYMRRKSWNSVFLSVEISKIIHYKIPNEKVPRGFFITKINSLPNIILNL